MKVLKIDIPIYFGYLRIITCEDFAIAAKKLNISDEGRNLSLYGAFVCVSRDKDSIAEFNVFFRPDVEADLIAHEVVHLVNAIFIDKGITLCPRNDEAQAYLTGWVTKEIYKALKKK